MQQLHEHILTNMIFALMKEMTYIQSRRIGQSKCISHQNIAFLCSSSLKSLPSI